MPSTSANPSSPSASTLTLPVLPLPDGVVLPGMVLTIALETAGARRAVEAAEAAGHQQLLLVPKVDDRFATVGAVARIESGGTLPGGVRVVVVRSTGRAQLLAGVAGLAGTADVLWLQAEPVEETSSDEAEELAVELRAAYRALFESFGAARLADELRGLEGPGALADAAGSWPDLDTERRVELLETTDVTDRVRLVLGWVKSALAESELTKKIRSDVSEGLEKQQREFLLRQQLAAIRKELGDDTAGDDDADSYRSRFEERVLPDAVRAAVDKELGRLDRTSDQSPEQGWIRTWLDTVLDLPWDARSEDRLDLVHARAVLDADHTGLDDVKERIIEELAVRKLRHERGLDVVHPVATDATDDDGVEGAGRDPSDNDDGVEGVEGAPGDDQGVPGDPNADLTVDISTAEVPRGRVRHATILTLVGPPGVGKTSLGESIARALDRKFVRVALGGVRDEAEIRGHRRTYVGARPGRIVRALEEAGTMNPVFLLDEIDKVGADWRGDPSAALLEVLDPAQNHSFRDHYLEVDLDLSEVIFLATANQLDTIPAPLLDRMEIVTLDGYTEAEKVAIARHHLLARQLEKAGLRPEEVTVTDEALRRIVADHTREAGVRSLERAVGKVLRKVAAEVAVADDGADVTVDSDDVPRYLGRARFHAEEVRDRTSVPGVATGLAVTGAGGDVLFVEATTLPPTNEADGDEPRLTVTGQLGDVMKESATIALSYVRSHRDALGIPTGADRRNIHVHFPAGAVPKDGPSAGVTMTTALVSLLTGRAVKASVGMTGEVTLQGRVLPIGGVKQKVLAAHRAGLTEVILPKRNEADLDDVPDSVRADLTIHLADDVADVVRWALEPAA